MQLIAAKDPSDKKRERIEKDSQHIRSFDEEIETLG